MSLYTVLPRDRTDERLKAEISKDDMNVAFLTVEEEKRLFEWLKERFQALSITKTVYFQCCKHPELHSLWIKRIKAYPAMEAQFGSLSAEAILKGGAAKAAGHVFLTDADLVKYDGLVRDVMSNMQCVFFSITNKTAAQAEFFHNTHGGKTFAGIPPHLQTEAMCVKAVKENAHNFKYCAVRTMPVLEALFQNPMDFVDNMFCLPVDFDPNAFHGPDPGSLRARIQKALDHKKRLVAEEEERKKALSEAEALVARLIKPENKALLDAVLPALRNATRKPRAPSVKRVGTRAAAKTKT